MARLSKEDLALPVTNAWLEANPPYGVELLTRLRQGVALIKFRAGWRLRILPARRTECLRQVDLEAFPDEAAVTCWLSGVAHVASRAELVALYEMLSRDRWEDGKRLDRVAFRVVRGHARKRGARAPGGKS